METIGWLRLFTYAAPHKSSRHLTKDGKTTLCGYLIPHDRKDSEILKDTSGLRDCGTCSAL